MITYCKWSLHVSKLSSTAALKCHATYTGMDEQYCTGSVCDSGESSQCGRVKTDLEDKAYHFTMFSFNALKLQPFLVMVAVIGDWRLSSFRTNNVLYV